VKPLSPAIKIEAATRAVMERVSAEKLDYVRCQFIDLAGILRGRAVHRNYLASVLDRGIPFAQVNNAVDIDDAESDLALGSQAGDFWAVPDPTTLRRVPHTEASGQVFADLVAGDGTPWPTCGRAAVRRVSALVERELGTVALGFEQEGYVLRKTESGYEPVVVGKQMQPETLDRLDSFVTDLTPALELMGVPVEKLTAEGGWGMFEVNFEQALPLEAAERWFCYKQAFRIVAREHGMVGSFMPKPFADGVGAGLHIHVSCQADGEDVLGGGLPGTELTERGRRFLGGVLEHAPALIALGSPSVNSFKRLRAGTWAPTHATYGVGNRSAMVRIVQGRTDLAGQTPPRRLEIRSPDGTCNPYLLAAGVLAAGLDGLRRRCDPGAPITYDTAHPDATGGRGEAPPPRLPKTLDTALDGLEADGPMRELLGPELVDAYIKVKRIEWAKFMTYVTDWEHRYYAEFY
jgi:glutamine synthetase